jgi:SLAP domain-containing protein
MISFFKKLRSSGTKAEADMTSTTKEERLEVKENQDVRPVMGLHFPDEFNNQFSQEDRYVLQFFVSELPPVEEGKLAIDGYKIGQTVDGLVVLAVLRNNMDVDIALEQVPLMLQDAQQNTIARSVFDMSEAGAIPAYSAVPWRFVFPYSDFLMPQMDLSSWSIGFHMESGVILTAVSELDFETTEEFSLSEHIEAQDHRVHMDIQRALMETEGQIGFMVGRVDVSEEGEYSVLLLVRNGCEEELRLPDNVSVTLLDGAEETVAEGLFDLSENPVPPLSVVSYTLTYPADAVRKADPDLSGWSVAVEMR